MKKNTLVQFVCFATSLELDDFVPRWEHYAKKLAPKKSATFLHQLASGFRGKYHYVSLHEWPDSDTRFSFTNEKRSLLFPESNVRTVQAGGYQLVDIHKKNTTDETDTKLIAFISHEENDINFYTNLPQYNSLHLYQAYYENCAYGYIAVFYVNIADRDQLLLLLKQRVGAETAVYEDCLLAHS
jgi:hypothetical protein